MKKSTDASTLLWTILLRLSSLELFSIWLNSTKFYEFQCMFMQICTYQEEYATYQTFYTEHRSPLTDFSLEVLWEMTCWWTVKNCNESFVCALYNRIYSYSLLPIFHSVIFLFLRLAPLPMLRNCGQYEISLHWLISKIEKTILIMGKCLLKKSNHYSICKDLISYVWQIQKSVHILTSKWFLNLLPTYFHVSSYLNQLWYQK